MYATSDFNQFYLASSCDFGLQDTTCPVSDLDWVVYVQRSTVVLLNCALLGCIASLSFLLFVTIGKHPSLPIHVGIVLLLAIAVLLMINW